MSKDLSKIQAERLDLDDVATNVLNTEVATTKLQSKQDVSNLTTTLSAESTNLQYPSAKCVYDIIGNLEEIINNL